MKTLLLVLILTALLVLSAVFSLYAWMHVGDVRISVNGLIAMGAGAFVSIALGVGLMWLVFKSNRDGFDQ